MAKKKKNVVLENVELRPQVIGYTYKKKSNFGRVIFILVVFILAVYYINDLSYYINTILNRKTAQTILDNQESSKDKNPKPETDEESEEENYYSINDTLSIKEGDLVLNNFKNVNNTITFDVLNSSNTAVDMTQKKYFLETYDNDYTLLERFKVDFNTIKENSKISISLNNKLAFNYISLVEKKVEDYPSFNVSSDSESKGILTCKQSIDTITYTFNDNKLVSITHNIEDNDVTDSNYSTRYLAYQNKVNQYNNINGVSASIVNSATGYKVSIVVDLKQVNSNTLVDKYYYSYNEEAKVIKFEMETYGFKCS